MTYLLCELFLPFLNTLLDSFEFVFVRFHLSAVLCSLYKVKALVIKDINTFKLNLPCLPIHKIELKGQMQDMLDRVQINFNIEYNSYIQFVSSSDIKWWWAI